MLTDGSWTRTIFPWTLHRKKYWLLLCLELLFGFPTTETELIRRIFSSTKRRKKRKKGSVILVGMGRVSCRNSYQVRSGMNYAGIFIHAGTISRTFILRWVHLNMSELGREFIFMSHEYKHAKVNWQYKSRYTSEISWVSHLYIYVLASLFQNRILNANDITLRN